MHTDRTIPFLLVALVLTGCTDEVRPPPLDATLTDGIRVSVSDRGGVALFDGDRPLWASPDGAFPTARTFEERATGALAIWTFRRTGEQIVPFDRYLGARRDDDGSVLVEYAGGGGQATVTIAPGPRPRTTLVRLALRDVDAQSIALPVRCDPDGSFHGFGEQYDATDQRGHALTLIASEQGIGRDGGLRDLGGDAHTTYFPMPYYLDARGFGALVRTDHRVEADVCAEDPSVAWLEVVDDAPVELLVLHGPTPLDVVAQLGDEVGRPALPPDWAFRPWIGAQGGRDEVLATVAALRAADVPFGAIWSQDWTGVRMNVGGGFGVQYRWRADETHYPDLAGMIAELHADDVRFLAYANPFVDPDLPDHFAAMRDADLLVRDPSGGPYLFTAPNGESAHPDFTRAETVAYVEGELGAMVTGLGIDGWMADFGEWTPLDAVVADGSEPAAYHHRFVRDWHCTNRAAIEAARPDGDWVLFARSGWAGVQRCTMIHWVGDQEATWSDADGLPTVVPAMINLGLAGVPYVTHDIAGFSGGPSTQDLYMRWTELGAFSPIMRTHEGNRRDLNHDWDADAETIAHFRRFARIHEALGPELRAIAEQAQTDSRPMVRHLMLEFPSDRSTWPISDQYLLGPDLLVAPITAEGAVRRSVYLPAGATWFHVWTGEAHDGGRTIEIDAPIGSPPVFARDADRADLRAIE